MSKEFDAIKERIQVVHSDPVAYFGQRWTTTSVVQARPVDQEWMAVVLSWLRNWAFTEAQAEHLMVIIRAQTVK
jgi:hypothetical protein